MNVIFPCLHGERWKETLTEKHVQAAWYDSMIRPAKLYSREGEEVRVIDPGVWNLEEGPDFHDALLEIGEDRRHVRGDVEIHIHPSDWTAHGHGDDPNYAHVVAHVTWFAGEVPPTLPEGAISIVLSEEITRKRPFEPEWIDLSCYPLAKVPEVARPCQDKFGCDNAIAQKLLAHAGRKRLLSKAGRLGALLDSRPGERMQVVYEEVMNAFGYRRNSRNFRFIAKVVPYSVVANEPENVEKAYLSVAEFLEWDRRFMRPNNSPERRLCGAAEFFANAAAMSIFDTRDFSPPACKKAVKLLMASARLGAGRAGAIFSNIIVPLALAEGRIDSVPEWLPPEDISSPMRLMAFRLLGRDHNPAAYYARNGLQMQGLVQIHREFCLEIYPICESCALVALGAA